MIEIERKFIIYKMEEYDIRVWNDTYFGKFHWRFEETITSTFRSYCSLLLAGLLLGFDAEVGVDASLKNVGEFLANYMALQSRGSYSL
jgi:hypothetical protein